MSAIHWQNVNKEFSLHKNELECFSLLTQISSSNLALKLFEEKMSAINLNHFLDKTWGKWEQPLYLHLVNRAVENCLFFGRLKKIEIDICAIQRLTLNICVFSDFHRKQ